MIISGSREAVLVSLNTLDPKDWRDLKAAITAVEKSSWDSFRVELKKVKRRIFRKSGLEEIWITTLNRTVLIFLAQRKT